MFNKKYEIEVNDVDKKYKNIFLSTKKDLYKILKKVCEIKDLQSAKVGLLFVSGNKIHSINKESRKIDKQTDVLSFPMNELLEGKYYLGDVVINADLIEKQALDINSDKKTETKYLFMHSLLHLIGYDHDSEESFKRMRKEEKRIFLELGIRND